VLARICQHQVHQDLGLLARDEHALVHGEGEVAERRASHGIRERRAVGPAFGGRAGALDERAA
jgi:hypothetical protein